MPTTTQIATVNLDLGAALGDYANEFDHDGIIRAWADRLSEITGATVTPTGVVFAEVGQTFDGIDWDKLTIDGEPMIDTDGWGAILRDHERADAATTWVEPTEQQITEWTHAVLYAIAEDMRCHRLPNEVVGSFAELHNHVDANGYLLNAGVPWGEYVPDRDDDPAGVRYQNAVTDAVDAVLGSEDRGQEFDLEEVARILQDDHGIEATCEQTGGGVATVYAGGLIQDDYYAAVGGPGDFGWGSPSTGHVFEFFVSPECELSWPEGQPRPADIEKDDWRLGTTPAEVAAHLAYVVGAVRTAFSAADDGGVGTPDDADRAFGAV